MKIYLSPAVSNDSRLIKINGEQVQVDDKLYDFTNLPNGKMRNTMEYREGAEHIEDAVRINGELFVKIINLVKDNATQEELFPQWQAVSGEDVLDSELTVVEIDWYSDEQKALDDAIPKPLTLEEEIRLEMARSNAEMFEMVSMLMIGGT